MGWALRSLAGGGNVGLIGFQAVWCWWRLSVGGADWGFGGGVRVMSQDVEWMVPLQQSLLELSSLVYPDLVSMF